MSLVTKKSLYDRHTLMDDGEAVGTSTANQGNYFAGLPTLGLGGGSFVNSPFDGTGDHLKDLLTKAVTSENHPYIPQGSITYNEGSLDLNATMEGTFSNQPLNPGLGQFGGPYSVTGPGDGIY